MFLLLKTITPQLLLFACTLLSLGKHKLNVALYLQAEVYCIHIIQCIMKKQ